MPANNSTTEEHQKQLGRHCRVCGRKAAKMKPCSDNRALLSEAFTIDVSNDDSSVHPCNLCPACYQRGRRILTAKHKGTPYTTTFSPVVWTPHEGDSCLACDRFRQQSQGGRPKRVQSTQGRPGLLSPHTIWSTVQALGVKSLRSGSPLHPSRFEIPASVSLSDIQCPFCHNILDGPVQLLCGKLACGARIVMQGEKLLNSCPCCNGEHTNLPESLRTPPDVAQSVLGRLLVQCDQPNCAKYVALKDLPAHIKQGCSPSGTVSEDTTVGQILSQPLNAQTTNMEKRVASNIVQRMMAEDKVVQLPTARKVNIHVCMPTD